MNALWIPIYSMRSYETGKYSILKDGNFQLALARSLASNITNITIAVPKDSPDFEDMRTVLRAVQPEGVVSFVELQYGLNAVDTRERFWDLNRDELHKMLVLYEEFDVLICDFSGYAGDVPFIFNPHPTKLPELDRPYIDKFFEQDLEMIGRSVFTTVLNPREREYILEVRPDLLDKVIAHSKCANALLLPKFDGRTITSKTVFWPFRISDKAYRWEQFYQAFIEQELGEDGFTIVITDPNDSFKGDLPAFVTKTKPSKTEYYQILASRPFIVMLDDIDTVLHPGTIEFFHYKCPTITFESALIQNENSITNLDQLGSALNFPVYNVVDTEVWRFVYRQGEIDQYYNEEFICVRQN